MPGMPIRIIAERLAGHAGRLASRVRRVVAAAGRLGAMAYGGLLRRLSGDRLGVEPSSVRSSAAAAVVGIIALLGIGVVLDRPARAMARVARAKPVVLAVWAHVDDNMPVAGATVRDYATARPPASWSGQPPARLLVRQSSLPLTERTYRTGVALLEFTRLPRAFTVEVTGGQARGRRLPGRFSVVVRNYRSGTVVDINPVTTLIADDVAGQPRLPAPIALARDHAQIYRLLGIPGWEDQVDLRYSARYFDGASYLRAAQRAGGIGRLDRAARPPGAAWRAGPFRECSRHICWRTSPCRSDRIGGRRSADRCRADRSGVQVPCRPGGLLAGRGGGREGRHRCVGMATSGLRLSGCA
jgi:hypothetical protein